MHDSNNLNPTPLSPVSRSAQKRQALLVRQLATELVALTSAQLAQLPIPDHIHPLIAACQALSSHIAVKRQLGFLAKQLRRETPETLNNLHSALLARGNHVRQQTATLHRAERWRDRLLDHPDSALTDFVNRYPQINRQALRQLLRKAHQEREQQRPPHAARRLLTMIRPLLDDPDLIDPSVD